jgi:hypothetical protein
MAATFAIVFPEAGGAKVEAELARNEHDRFYFREGSQSVLYQAD